MEEAGSRIVARRRVIHVGGFDPVEPERLDRRMEGGTSRLESLWGAKVKATPPILSSDERIIRWQVEAAGPNWSTATDFTILRWDEFVLRYMGLPWWRKILRGYGALGHFLLNGTIFRYFAANLRYGLFVLYPLFLLIFFAGLALSVAILLSRSGLPAGGLIGVVAGLALLVLLLHWAGSRLHVYFALADWAFAADLAKGRVEGFDACLDQFAQEIVRAASAADCDEVLLSGVSLGAVVMVEALARALDRDPRLCGHGPAVAFMTIGSSVLKIGLHSDSDSLKSAIGRVSRADRLLWIEYQSKIDPINFFKSDPVRDLGLPVTGKPVVRTIHIRKTMTPEEYRSLRTNFLRLHRQFSMPNSVRYFYDFYLICLGPMSLARRVALGERAVHAIGPDGSWREVPWQAGKTGIET